MVNIGIYIGIDKETSKINSISGLIISVTTSPLKHDSGFLYKRVYDNFYIFCNLNLKADYKEFIESDLINEFIEYIKSLINIKKILDDEYKSFIKEKDLLFQINKDKFTRENLPQFKRKMIIIIRNIYDLFLLVKEINIQNEYNKRLSSEIASQREIIIGGLLSYSLPPDEMGKILENDKKNIGEIINTYSLIGNVQIKSLLEKLLIVIDNQTLLKTTDKLLSRFEEILKEKADKSNLPKILKEMEEIQSEIKVINGNIKPVGITSKNCASGLCPMPRQQKSTSQPPDYECDKLEIIDIPTPTIPILPSRDISGIVLPNQHIGLVNNGNTCFMNTALQFVYSMEYVRNYFLKVPPAGLSIISCAIKTLFLKMYRSRPGEIINLETTYIDHNGKVDNLYNILTFSNDETKFNYRAQEDCREYLQFLIDKLVSDKININNNLEKLFSINILNLGSCSNLSKSPEVYRQGNNNSQSIPIIQLEIKNNDGTLQGLINNYFTSENITEEESKLEYCKQLTGYGESKLLKRQPIPLINDCNKYLIISIKRWNSEIIYNEDRTRVMGFISNKTMTPINPNPIINIKKRLYKLTSCAVHEGADKEGGHYVLYKYDDDGNNISIISDRDVDLINPGSRAQTSAAAAVNGYIFLYRYIGLTEREEDIKKLVNETDDVLLNYNVRDIADHINPDHVRCIDNRTPVEIRPAAGAAAAEETRKLERIEAEEAVRIANSTPWYNKYLKYKNKYLKLKQKFIKYQ